MLGNFSKSKAKYKEKNQSPWCDFVVIEEIWYDEGILGAKIGVQQLPLFKFLLSGYAKVKTLRVDVIKDT